MKGNMYKMNAEFVELSGIVKSIVKDVGLHYDFFERGPNDWYVRKLSNV
jgi:hypothetical protein